MQDKDGFELTRVRPAEEFDLIEWSKEPPTVLLRKFPNGTLFLLKLRNQCIHVCRLVGNLPADEDWKFLDLSNYRTYCLEKKKFSRCSIILHSVDDLNQLVHPVNDDF